MNPKDDVLVMFSCFAILVQEPELLWLKADFENSFDYRLTTQTL